MMIDTEDQAHWSAVAREWIEWARAPNHDAFWAYADRFNEFVGAGRGPLLDLGCGEGRVSRALKALGYEVTASDAVAAMVDAARQSDSADHYVVAPAATQPLPGGAFDRVVAYNMLMDVEDVPAVLREMRRLLRPDGEVIISIVHPFADRGRFEADGADAPFVLKGSYFGRQRFEGVAEEDGLRMHFAGWSQPLHAYSEALFQAGFAITGLSEPLPLATSAFAKFANWSRVPLFLWLKARPFSV